MTTIPTPETPQQFYARLGTDAQAWAKEFIAAARNVVGDHGGLSTGELYVLGGVLDENFLTGWFANAIEHTRAVTEAKNRTYQMYNGLTAAEIERFVIAAEEGAEIVQAAMKIIRHGKDSYNPDAVGGKQVTNIEHFQKELGDLRGIRKLMTRAGDISASVVSYFSTMKLERLARYTHHQQADLLVAERDEERRSELAAKDH